jgi:hypothetical protein
MPESSLPTRGKPLSPTLHTKIAQAANGHCTKPNPLLQKQSKEFRIEKATLGSPGWLVVL